MVDVLAVGAHSDDVEIGIAGLVHKLTSEGHKVAILDLTRAEMSSRGPPASRAEEARNAAGIMGVSIRETVGLPDAGLQNTAEQQRQIIPFLRKLRPRIILAPMCQDRHPDHNAAHALLRDAHYFAGLSKIDTGQKPHRPERVYYYHPYFEGDRIPSMVVDVTGHYEAKVQALKAYESQFHNPDFEGVPTYISSLEFWKSIELGARYWGRRIGVEYAEALFCDGPVALDGLPGLEKKL
jgi:bacillithiol biosynthesis deacetylase BshB1